MKLAAAANEGKVTPAERENEPCTSTMSFSELITKDRGQSCLAAAPQSAGTRCSRRGPPGPPPSTTSEVLVPPVIDLLLKKKKNIPVRGK